MNPTLSERQSTGLGIVPVLVVKGAIQALKLWHGRSKLAGQRRLTATEIVDAVEPVMQQNVDEYLSFPDRDRETQLAYVVNFDDMWQMVADTCGSSELGQAGRRCISDRIRGGQFDWFVKYRDPIGTDTEVGVSPIMASLLPQPLQELVAGVPWELFAGVGLVVGALLVSEKKG